MELHFEIQTDLYVAGKTEDGLDYTAEMYFVVAENENGDRWAHCEVFPGCRREVNYDEEDGWEYICFADLREEAMGKAERLLNRILATGGKIDMNYWKEARPAYGSNAYLQYGQYNDWMEERMEG